MLLTCSLLGCRFAEFPVVLEDEAPVKTDWEEELTAGPFPWTAFPLMLWFITWPAASLETELSWGDVEVEVEQEVQDPLTTLSLILFTPTTELASTACSSREFVIEFPVRLPFVETMFVLLDVDDMTWLEFKDTPVKSPAWRSIGYEDGLELLVTLFDSRSVCCGIQRLVSWPLLVGNTYCLLFNTNITRDWGSRDWTGGQWSLKTLLIIHERKLSNWFQERLDILGCKGQSWRSILVIIRGCHVIQVERDEIPVGNEPHETF